jgi:peptidoglycan/LPS O-acetylase OafA/YrhL
MLASSERRHRLMTNTNPDPSRVRHIPALDGVRGLAILLVMLFHFSQGFGSACRLDKAIMVVLRMGWLGVDVFFVLSGFLITGILIDSKGGADYFQKFYLRRAVRIFPLYYLTLFVLFVVPRFVTSAQSPEYLTAHSMQSWYWLYLTNWLVAKQGNFVPYAHFWSLAVEEQFYMFWPLLVFWLSSRALRQVCVACVVGALAFRAGCFAAGCNWIVPTMLTPGRIDDLAVGAFIAATIREPGGAAMLMKRGRVAAIGAALVLGWIAVRGHGLWTTPAVLTIGLTAFGVLAGFLVLTAAIAPAGPISSVLVSRPLRLLGKYSYCLYIVHWFVMWRLIDKLTDDLLPRVAGSALPGRLLFMAASFTGSLLIAVVSWELFEKRWLKLRYMGVGRRT